MTTNSERSCASCVHDECSFSDQSCASCDGTSNGQPISAPSGGGELTGNHYYRVEVKAPISSEVQPYTAECADIIEALGMTFNEGEAFKALWRLAAARQGRVKAGGDAKYDADKVAHYGSRVAAHSPSTFRT